MKGGFFDFVVYRIPEVATPEESEARKDSISEKRILLFVSAPDLPEVKNKLLQIVGAVGLKAGDVDILSHDLALPDWKGIMEAHHEKGIIFSDASIRPGGLQTYQVYKAKHGEIVFADDIGLLIQDERDGITQRRKALWLILKSWML